MADGIKVKSAYAIIYDDSPNHIMDWPDNQLKIPAVFDDETGEYSVQTTALTYTSWHQSNHKFHAALFAEDDAGNIGSVDSTDEMYGSQLAIRVLEKDKPIIKPTPYAIYDSYNKTYIPFPMIGFADGGPYELPDFSDADAYDDEGIFAKIDKCIPYNKNSGLDFSTLKYYIDGEEFVPTYVRWEWDPGIHDYIEEEVDPYLGVFAYDPPPSMGYEGGYEIGYAYYYVNSYSSDTGILIDDLSSGRHTFKAVISDNDGNEATYEKEFLIHTSSPYLEVILPVINYQNDTFLTNSRTVEVSFKVKPNEDGTPIDRVEIECRSDSYNYWTDTMVIPGSELGEVHEDGFYYVEKTLELSEDDVPNFVISNGVVRPVEGIVSIQVYDTLNGSVYVGRGLMFDLVSPWIEDVTTEVTTVDGSDKIKIQFRIHDLPGYSMYDSDLNKSYPFNYTSTQIIPIEEGSDGTGYLEASYYDRSKVKFKLTGSSRKAVDLAEYHVTSSDPEFVSDFTISDDPDDPHSKILESEKEFYFVDGDARYSDNNMVGDYKDSWRMTIDSAKLKDFPDINIKDLGRYTGKLGGYTGSIRGLERLIVRQKGR